MKNILAYDNKQLLFDIPLYEKLTVDITEINKESRDEDIEDYDFTYVQEIYEEKYPTEFNRLIEFLIYEEPTYAYCNKCKKENSLQVLKVNIDEKLNNKILYCQVGDDFEDYNKNTSVYELENRINLLVKNNEFFTKMAYCSHNNKHKFTFIYEIEFDGKNLTLQKIGQTPSGVELHNRELDNKYSKYKNYKEIKSDLSKALISYQSKFSVGGFLYLRRVLENIIRYKYEDVKEKLDETKQEKFNLHNTKFSEKIAILKDYLPDYITGNKYIYSILSKGVHTLSEEECEEYFSIVEKSIYIIIEELLEIQEKGKLKREIEKELNKINSEIKTS